MCCSRKTRNPRHPANPVIEAQAQVCTVPHFTGLKDVQEAHFPYTGKTALPNALGGYPHVVILLPWGEFTPLITNPDKQNPWDAPWDTPRDIPWDIALDF